MGNGSMSVVCQSRRREEELEMGWTLSALMGISGLCWELVAGSSLPCNGALFCPFFIGIGRGFALPLP